MKHKNEIITLDLTPVKTKSSNLTHAGKIVCKKSKKYIRWIGKLEKKFIVKHKLHKQKFTYDQYMKKLDKMTQFK